MLTSSWINYQEIHNASNPGQPLVVDYYKFMTYVLKMSLAHDAVSPLSDRQAHSTRTGNVEHDCIREIALDLADLGYPSEVIQDFQVRAARRGNRRRSQRNQKDLDPDALILDHLLSQTSPEFKRAWMDEPDQTLKSSILLAAAKKLKNKDLPIQRQSRSQQAHADELDPSDDHSLDGSIDCSDYITNEYNTFSVDQYGQPYTLLRVNTSSQDTNSGTKKPTSILKVHKPKPKKSKLSPASAMRLLADTKGELCLKDGTLFGYLQHATPK